MYIQFKLPITIALEYSSSILINDLEKWGKLHNIEIKLDKSYFFLGFLKVYLSSDRAYEFFCLSWEGNYEWTIKK